MSEKLAVGLAGKKLILKKLNTELTQDELDSLTTAQEADDLIAFYKSEGKKNATPSLQLGGIPKLDNKPPEERKENMSPQEDSEPYSKEELYDPLQVDVSRCNLADPEEGRILKLYSDEFPQGRIV
jgi:hypothetical protein